MIRITDEKIYIQDDGTTKRKIVGSCNNDDKVNLPTSDIINDSYMLIVDNGTVSFFNEDTSAWG